jgi:hypothetical protein
VAARVFALLILGECSIIMLLECDVLVCYCWPLGGPRDVLGPIYGFLLYPGYVCLKVMKIELPRPEGLFQGTAIGSRDREDTNVGNQLSNLVRTSIDNCPPILSLPRASAPDKASPTAL